MSQQEPKKRIHITAAQKTEICLIKQQEPNKKNVDLAKEFGISKGQVSDILKNSNKWLDIDPNSYKATLKKSRPSPLINIEETLILWIEKALESNLTITGAIIQQKALNFADLLSYPDFKASQGWLENFKHRYSIKAFNKHGEAQSTPISEIPQMREDLREVLRQYRREDIFNCDETALFWKMEPNRGLSTQPLSGIKKNKDRVTILLTCNSTGTEKLNPLFIHKFQNPRPLRGIRKDTLPVDYYWNNTSWMQISIWNNYLKKLNKKMQNENRNILLLVDNAPTHTLTEDVILTNITIHYLPPNTTTHLQPCDAGIIHSFKAHYKKLFLKKKIINFEEEQSGLEPDPINIYHAIKMVATAWNFVTPVIIYNCWKKTGILPEENIFYSIEMEQTNNLVNEILQEEENAVQDLINNLPINSALTAAEFISIDDAEVNVEMPTDEQIISSLTPTEEEIEENIPILPHIPIKDAVTAFETAHKFLQQDNDGLEFDYNELKVFRALKKKINLYNYKNLNQEKITSYFTNQ
jgi:hypothetical protein